MISVSGAFGSEDTGAPPDPLSLSPSPSSPLLPEVLGSILTYLLSVKSVPVGFVISFAEEASLPANTPWL